MLNCWCITWPVSFRRLICRFFREMSTVTLFEERDVLTELFLGKMEVGNTVCGSQKCVRMLVFSWHRTGYCDTLLRGPFWSCERKNFLSGLDCRGLQSWPCRWLRVQLPVCYRACAVLLRNLARAKPWFCGFALTGISLRRQNFKCNNLWSFYICNCVLWRHALAQLVEALRYKPEGRGFDSRWCHWNFSLT